MITKWGGDLPIWYRNKLRLWIPETMPNFESTLPGLYMGIRCSWYTHADPQRIVDSLFAGVYGAAARMMAAYWRGIDSAWSATPEHAGNVFAYGKIFAPEVMRAARGRMDSALAACATPMEYRRVKLADDSFREFELLMRMRRDLFEGRWTNLENEGRQWQNTWDVLAEEYKPYACFSSFAKRYFNRFQYGAYQDAARIAAGYRILGRPQKEWKYQVDSARGTPPDFSAVDLQDSAWAKTDPCVDTWSDLGLGEYYGRVWYRAVARMPVVSAGKKMYIWIGSTDGSCSLFINGRHVPYANAAGDTATVFSGYCIPASYDITAYARPGTINRIAICATRLGLNELGGGGLNGPVGFYCEK
jgi:hypothetical protein